jgi:hypothetical protein
MFGDLDLSNMFPVAVENPQYMETYIASVVAFASAARPGSIAKSSVIPKSISPSMEETWGRMGPLCWQDLQFYATTAGIATQLTLRVNEGNTVSSATNMDPRRVYFFYPINGARLHLDVSLLLFGLALQRVVLTLDVDTISSLCRSQGPVDISKLNVKYGRREEPIFTNNGSGSESAPRPLELQVYTRMLSLLAARAGYIGTCSMYSFRRGALVAMRTKHGALAAQELAGHSNARTIWAYIRQPLVSMDLLRPVGSTTEVDVSSLHSLRMPRWQPEDDFYHALIRSACQTAEMEESTPFDLLTPEFTVSCASDAKLHYQ